MPSVFFISFIHIKTKYIFFYTINKKYIKIFMEYNCILG